MSQASRQLIAQAHRRARQVRAARDPQLHDALIRRVLFDLRAALSDFHTDVPLLARQSPPRARPVAGRPFNH